jgi:hypothetical protein
LYAVPMTFFVEACIDDHCLSVTAASAKQALAEAVDWHIAKRLVGVTINDGERSYTLAEFADAMARLELAATTADEGFARPRRRLSRW